MKQWERMPSVTTGGKAYFYVRNDFTSYPHPIRQSIVWDRQAKSYCLSHNGLEIGYTLSVVAGKIALDSLLLKGIITNKQQAVHQSK